MVIDFLLQKFKYIKDDIENIKEITGLTSHGRSFLLSCIFNLLNKTVFFITSTEERALQVSDEAKFFLGSTNNIYNFYEKEEFENQRLNVLDSITKNKDKNNLIISSIKAVLQKTVSKDEFKKAKISLTKNEKYDLASLIKQLVSFGYEKNYMVNSRGEFSQRGCILDIFPSNFNPVRIEFLYDAIESIRVFDPVTQRSTELIDSVNILPAKELDSASNILDYLPKNSLIILDEPASLKLHVMEYLDDLNIKEFDLKNVTKNKKTLIFSRSSEEEGPGILKLNFKDVYSFGGKMPQVYENLKSWSKEGITVLIVSTQYNRLKDILSGENIPSLHYNIPGQMQKGQIIITEGKIKNGFLLEESDLIVLSDSELFGSVYRPPHAAVIPKKSVSPKDEIKLGDFIVHKNYGIAKFARLNCMEIEGSKKDYLILEFDKGARLYHPFDQMDLLERYVAPEGSHVKLSLLGSSVFLKSRAKIKESVKEVAAQLLKLYAERQKIKGYRFSSDTVWQSELEAAFPFEETPDQLDAIKCVKQDMESELPTDRLICGDAGFGKTEVALRAAFKAATDHKQTAVLVPTTVLAQQHYETFSERLSTFPVKVEVLSRFKTPSQQKKIIEGLIEGKVDIIIGTHRLLQKDIKFKNLGLLIIDEEHRFGVKQKENLKQMKKNLDCITLTATPIPRTFQMAVSGIKNLSMINTPPEHRIPVKTYLFEYSKDIIKGALIRELERGGQVFYLNDRVRGIEKEAAALQKLIPHARITIAHGQMPVHKLEDIMHEFTQHKYDILVCTTIIESGLDIPEANTIIIRNAQNFGLSQLYQIRGRVGRRNLQAFAYFLYPRNTVFNSNAVKRMETLKEFSDLGSGFQIALKDLEIRGAGNLLGTAQHGFIEAVGFNEYCRLIKEAVSELKGEDTESPPPSPTIDIPLQAYIPEEYISDKKVKLEYYKKLADFKDIKELESIKKEFTDLFGPYPVEMENLFIVISLRILALKHRITKIKMTGNFLNIIDLKMTGIPVKLIYGLSNRYNVKVYFKDKNLVIEGALQKKNWFRIIEDILDKLSDYFH
ncbi:MAG: transcription-repair coupling factor [Armatimonadota bacterium]